MFTAFYIIESNKNSLFAISKKGIQKFLTSKSTVPGCNQAIIPLCGIK
tara:strand:+ start:438 stop:581 length:144 start_codon:yes stop_codon:yes gene_type:complete